jgi:hypothetical protein
VDGQAYFDELLKYIFTYLQNVIGNVPAMIHVPCVASKQGTTNNKQTTAMNPEPELIEAYLLGRIGTICPFTDGLLVDAWECGFIHAMNA